MARSSRLGRAALRWTVWIACAFLPRIATADAMLYVTNMPTSGSWEILRYNATTGVSAGRFATLPGDSFGVAAGPDGNIYVSNFGNYRVDRYNGVTGAFMNTFATMSGAYGNPYDITFGPDGNLYVGMSVGDVLKFNGTTGASLGRFTQAPSGVFGFGGMAFRGDKFFVSYGGSGSGNNGKLYSYNATTGGDSQLIYGSFSNNGPHSPVFDAAGNVYVPDYQTTKILKFTASTYTLSGTITTVSPWALDFNPAGELLVLTDNGSSSTIRRYDSASGSFLGTLVQSGSAGLGRGFTLSQIIPIPEVDPAGIPSVMMLVAGSLSILGRRRLPRR